MTLACSFSPQQRLEVPHGVPVQLCQKDFADVEVLADSSLLIYNSLYGES
jgi:hypothetical protein